MIPERLAIGLVVGFVLFWFGACSTVRGDGVADWWLPVALSFGLGVGLGAPLSPLPAVHGAVRPLPRWLTGAALLLMSSLVLLLGYGAVATPPQHRDGAAAFDAKAFWLAQALTLRQPFFADPAVFHHSPDYPLMQPLLVAATERLWPGHGRLVLPLVFVTLLAMLGSTLRRSGTRPWLSLLVTLAVALTPALLGPSGGAVDSGYADPLLLLATTTIASGFATGRPWFVALGVVGAIASKPEGLPYAALALAVAFASGDWLTLRRTALLAALALAVWLPVRDDLLHVEPSARSTGGLLLALAAMVFAVRLAPRLGSLRSLSPARAERVRWGIVLLPPVAGLLLLPWLSAYLPQHGAFGVYLRQADQLWHNLTNLGPWALAVVRHVVLRLDFGATLLLPIAAWFVLRRRQQPLPARALLGFVLLGVATTALPFVLSPESDLQHHLKSSLPRLFLHWLGPLWLWAALATERVLQGERA